MIPALGAIVSIILGQPLFVVFGLLAILCFSATGDGIDSIDGLLPMIERIRELADKDVLLAIPFFVIAGSIMTRGQIAQKLINVARSFVGWLPGGLAVAAVLGCIFFAAISGSSPATVIAIGAIMLPALKKEGFSENFSLGLVTTSGSLGILIPPSIPMVVYAIAKSGGQRIDLADLFLAGVGPGIFIGGLLMTYAIFSGVRMNVKRHRFSISEVGVALKDGFWALMLPVLILGGIYSGLFTPTEAAGVAVVYALVVEVWVHREMSVDDLPQVLGESAVLMGSLLVIMVLALGFNDWMVDREIPARAAAFIKNMHLGPLGFMLVTNLLLLLAGFLMDILSAILILVPLLAPIGEALGIDPIHLAIVFIVNLELGYMTPPVGMNLFVASSVFRKPLGQVVRAVVPTMTIMLVALVCVSYIPTVSLGFVRVLHGESFYVPFPDGVAADEESATDRPVDDGPNPTGKVKSLKGLMREAEEDDDEGGEAEAEDAPKKPEKKRVKSLQEMMREAEESDDED